MDDLQRKLTAARTRLILDKPFLGALVLRLPLIEVNELWCSTSATDARSIYYNPGYIDQLSLSQVQFVLAHEALHCGLSHFARRENRDRKRWDVACDYAVNSLLVDDGLEQPPGTLFDDAFDGMTAEEIYPCIDATDSDEPMDQHVYDDVSITADSLTVSTGTPVGYQSEPPRPLTELERDRLDRQWQQRLAGAAQQALQAGKLDGKIARLIERLARPSIPWRSLLARHMMSTARNDYNIMRPSQRREGDAILPSLHSRQIDVVVAIDTSGSIRQCELDEFVSEVNSIKGSINARLTMLVCDDVLDDNGPWVFEPWEPLCLPDELQGGGKTNFSPVFDWVASQLMSPDLLVYFTDARGKFPKLRPHVSTLWVIKGRGEVPWGQRIQLN